MRKEIGKTMKRGEPLHAALKRDFEMGKANHGISAESVGSDFDLGPDAIYKLCSEGAGKLPREMKTIIAWHYSTGGFEAAKWVAAEMGCILIANPKGGQGNARLGDLCSELGDILRKHDECEADGVWTADEFAEMDREIEELISAAHAYREEKRRQVQTSGRALSLKAASR